MDFQINSLISIDKATKRVLCMVLAVIILFSTGFTMGSLTGDGKQSNEAAGENDAAAATTAAAVQTTAVQSADTTAVTAAATTAATTAAAEQTTSAAATTAAVSDPLQATTAAAAAESTSAPAAAVPGVPSTTEEIVALFNDAVNKVKPEATKITRNFKNTRYDTEKSVLPSALQSMANPMIEKYVKDDTEPVEYLTKEEIIENFPVPKQDYSSKLTAADVTSATCTDNGTEYELTINLAVSNNPTAGVGVGAACHFMDVSSITSNESAKKMIKKFDVSYSDCVIKCKIDKATNRVTWANYYTPFCIDAIVNLVVSDLQTIAYMSYERDYTITY